MAKTKDLSKFTVNKRREKIQPSKHKMYYDGEQT